MNTRLRKVETIMPPNTAVPTEWRPGLAGALRGDERQHAEDERERGHQNRTEPDPRGFDRGLRNRQPALAQLLGEFDDQDRVLGGKADQHDQADLTVDVVGQAAQALRADGAEHRHRERRAG